MGDFFMGGIILFGGNFAPRDYAFCHGQLIAISQNQALFAILGNIWGGDGRTNFAVPDMRGRLPIGTGRGVGLTEVYQGRQCGTEKVALQVPNIPAHSHDAAFTPLGGGSGDISAVATATVNAHNGEGNQDNTGGGYWATAQAGRVQTTGGYSSDKNTTMAEDAIEVDVTVNGGGGITDGTVAIGATGSNIPFTIMQPTLGTQYIIALEGTFPPRN